MIIKRKNKTRKKLLLECQSGGWGRSPKPKKQAKTATKILTKGLGYNPKKINTKLGQYSSKILSIEKKRLKNKKL